jgi:hypothetical protein
VVTSTVKLGLYISEWTILTEYKMKDIKIHVILTLQISHECWITLNMQLVHVHMLTKLVAAAAALSAKPCTPCSQYC